MIALDDYIGNAEKKYSFTQEEETYVGCGCYGEVYILNETEKGIPLVGKVLYRELFDNFISVSKTKIPELKREYKIQKELYEAGVNVPEPFGIYLINEANHSAYYPGFVMEYLNGKIFREVPSSDMDKVVYLRDVEINKSRELGFNPIDSGAGNFIWVPEEEKVYLIDFGLWRRKRW